MASFEQHVNGAAVAAGVMVVPLHSSGLLDVKQSFVLLALGVLGGMLPDLDSDNSRPVQTAFKIIAIIFPLLLLLSLTGALSVVYMIGIWLVSAMVLHLVFFKIFLKLTSHRGIFHSVPMAVLCGQITVYIFYYGVESNLTFATIAGCFITFGFVVHLLLDEFISLNLMGVKMKRSFGTAFKFYDKNNKLGTVIVYSFVIFCVLFFPLDEEVLVEYFSLLKNIKII
jgi:hypothetical protein